MQHIAACVLVCAASDIKQDEDAIHNTMQVNTR